jgi:hypothetical protein
MRLRTLLATLAVIAMLTSVVPAVASTSSHEAKSAPEDYLAVIAGSKSVNDLLVARVTATGPVRVLGWDRVLRGRVGFDPIEARIAPGTHRIAVVFSTDADQDPQGLAIMNVDGTGLRTVFSPSIGFELSEPRWDASGTSLLVTTETGDVTWVYRLNTNAPKPYPQVVAGTRSIDIGEASFVGTSTSKLLGVDLWGNVFLLQHGHRKILHRSEADDPNEPVSSSSGKTFVFTGVDWKLEIAPMAHPARVAIAAAQNADHPSFSPGGTRLFYSNCPCLQGESDDSTLYYVNLAGGPARTIALDAGYASYEFGGIVSTGTPSPVLGNRLFVGDNGKGWGTQQPSVVYNGGDPGGLVLNLHWTGWGSATAYGTGKGYVPKPNGGWNPHPVVEQFRASGLAMCHGKLTYTRLYVRNASRPGAAVSAGWSSWVVANGDICQALQQ